jgi:hypothetical protein
MLRFLRRVCNAVAGCILAAGVTLESALPAAAEFPLQSEDIAAVLNAAARSVGFAGSFQMGECVEQLNATCSFTGRSVGGVATGKIGSPSHEVTILFAPGRRSSSDAVIAWGLLIAALSPDAEPFARGEVLMRLAEPVFKRRSERETTVLGDVRYTMLFSDMVGVWPMAESLSD